MRHRRFSSVRARSRPYEGTAPSQMSARAFVMYSIIEFSAIVRTKVTLVVSCSAATRLQKRGPNFVRGPSKTTCGQHETFLKATKSMVHETASRAMKGLLMNLIASCLHARTSLLVCFPEAAAAPHFPAQSQPFSPPLSSCVCVSPPPPISPPLSLYARPLHSHCTL